MFKRIGLALAFSPTCNALLAEALRLKELYKAELILIHVGKHDAESKGRMDELLLQAGLTTETTNVIWKTGDPANAIIDTCKKEKINLLIAGAKKHENLIKYYVGSIALKIVRQSPCSVLILTNPSVAPTTCREIIIAADDSPLNKQVLTEGITFARLRQTRHIFFAREIKLFGLTMAVMTDMSKDENTDLKKDLLHEEHLKVEKKLQGLDLKGQKYSIKILGGKPGYEIRKFAGHVNANLLVMGAVRTKMSFLDRLFTNNIEFVYEDIPCNLLIVNNI